jgi:DNA-binding LytR/AlgR family response regulator
MRVLIIEDEVQAAARLKHLLQEVNQDIQVIGTVDSVKSSCKWFSENPAPELIFMDIHLGDGISFEIFEQVKINVPVIFTTAYDEYALKAFKVNSIDYLLKPIDQADLAAALNKFSQLISNGPGINTVIGNINQVMNLLSRRFKERFVIRVGEHLRTIEVKDILFFFSQDKTTFCTTADKRNHILDFTLDQLEGMLDPDQFYRISRKYLVSSKAISDILAYSNSRLRLVLSGSDDKDVVVARERVQHFKEWLDR